MKKTFIISGIISGIIASLPILYLLFWFLVASIGIALTIVVIEIFKILM